MRVDSLDLPEEVKKGWMNEGIEELNPPQRESIDKGVLDGENLVVASPTASGKTLIAEMAFLRTILEHNRKAIYIVPLRALASEKYDDFRRYEKMGIDVAVSTGDLDSEDGWLADKDLIIATSEKLDSLLRHDVPWLKDVGLVISDEIHLLNDESRGPTLEVVLTRLKEVNPQILALSATVSNADEMAEWLDAEAVVSEYRPVTLRQGVYDGSGVRFEGGIRDFELDGSANPELLITEDTLERDKQLLVFGSSRRITQSIARKAGEFVEPFLTDEEKEGLEGLAEEVLNVPSQPTEQCEKLARQIRRGTAFHHAGLMGGQRKLIEDAFRDNTLKMISATPTLAAGVNLPAYRVVVRDVKRYHPAHGSVYIPALEYHQMAGRAGRPGYDDEGEAILIAKSRSDAREMVDRYIQADPEEIYSKLSVEPVLRMHVLALVATHIDTEESLREFFSRTFFVHQYGETEEIDDKLRRVLDRLEEQRFIDRNDGLQPTRIGKRVAQLYLDPETAHGMIEGLDGCDRFIDYLTLVSNTQEMYPLRLKKGEEEEMIEIIETRGIDAPSPWDLEYDDFLEALKTALVLEAWGEEKGEDYLYENYGVAPGELRTRISTADWMLYALKEIALLLNEKDHLKRIRKTRTRVNHGVREELLPLVRLRGVGRVRGRRLYEAGYTSINELKEANREELADMFGPKTAKKIYEQVHKDEEERQTRLKG